MQFENVRQHKCPLCEKSYKKKSTLKNHLSVHAGIRSHICNICGKGFTTKDYLSTHIKFHTSKKPFVCPICSHSFSTRGNFRRHTQRHKGEKNYVCRICHKGFTTDSNLLVHVKTHSSERPHVCSICNKDFLFKGALQRHIDNVHLVEKLDVCSVFSVGGFLTVNKRQELSEKAYTCSICEKCFDNKIIFKRHLHSHEGKKTYVCGICSKWFESYVDLEWHLRSHLGMEPHVCTICNRRFLENYRLTKHMKIHERENQQKETNEVLFSGEYSDVSTVSESSYSPCLCAHCNKEFRSKYLLNQHLKNHYDERPFVCSLCGLGFIYNSRLKAHMTTHGKIHKTIQQSQVSLGELETVIKEDHIVKEENISDCNEIKSLKTIQQSEVSLDELQTVIKEEHIVKEENIIDCKEMKSLSIVKTCGNGKKPVDSLVNEAYDSSAMIKSDNNWDYNKGKSRPYEREYITVFSGDDLIENISDEDPCTQNDDNAEDPLA